MHDGVRAQAITLADDVALLARWMREGVLAVNGLSYPERQELYDFVLGQCCRLDRRAVPLDWRRWVGRRWPINATTCWPSRRKWIAMCLPSRKSMRCP